MKKRTMAIWAAAAIASLSLAGCSGSGSSGAGSAQGDTAAAGAPAAAPAGNSAGKNEMVVEGDDVTTLNVWTFIELHQQFYTDMAELWNAENPDKKVKLVLSNMPYDDMHNKLSLALETGEGAPDVVDIELGKFPAFTVGEVGLMDLSEAIAPYQETVVQSRLDIYSKDGAVYGFPTHVGTTVAFYNDELLSAAGIDYKEIKTWDDFKAAGVKYNEVTGKTFACVETYAQWMINLMLAQKGGDYIDGSGNLDITNDTMVEVLEYIKGMQDTGAFATVPGGQPDHEEAYPFYNSGEYAVQIMPFWQTSRFINYMTDLNGKVAIAPVPVWGEGDKVATVGGGGTGTAIVKSGENAQLAAEVMAWIKLSEGASNEIWNVLGFDPVNTVVWTDTALTQNPENQFVQYFVNPPFDALISMQDGIGTLSAYTSEMYPSINNEFTNVTLNNIHENGMEVREALELSQETLMNEFR